MPIIFVVTKVMLYNIIAKCIWIFCLFITISMLNSYWQPSVNELCVSAVAPSIPSLSHPSPPPPLPCLVIWCWNMYLRIFNKLCICYLLMALSTAEPALSDRVTEGQRESEEIANRENWRKRWWRDKRERERSPKRVSVVPRGGQSDAISLSPPSLLHVETAFCHIWRQIVMHSEILRPAGSTYLLVRSLWN